MNKHDLPAPAYSEQYHYHHQPSDSSQTAIPLPRSSQPIAQYTETDPEDQNPLLPIEPHTHCEACDRRQREELQLRHNSQSCRMVAYTFMVLFVCAMVVVVVAVKGKG